MSEHRTPSVPEGMKDDARATWPSQDLIDSMLGDSMSDFALFPGDEVSVDPDDPEAVAAARTFRDTLGRFASGITVVTTISGGEPVGMTCQSFSSVSLNPPLVLFVPAKTSRAWPLMQRAGRFCVNFLADGQMDLSNQMASRGADKFAGIDWEPSPETGSPLLAGVLGFVDCRIHTVYEAGDHYIVIGRVLALESREGLSEKPLLYYQGAYATSTD